MRHEDLEVVHERCGDLQPFFCNTRPGNVTQKKIAMNSKYLNVRIPQELWDELQKKAKNDGSTVSKYVRSLLVYYVLKKR